MNINTSIIMSSILPKKCAYCGTTGHRFLKCSSEKKEILLKELHDTANISVMGGLSKKSLLELKILNQSLGGNTSLTKKDILKNIEQYLAEKNAGILTTPQTRQPAEQPAPHTRQPAEQPAPHTRQPAEQPAPYTEQPALQLALQTEQPALQLALQQTLEPTIFTEENPIQLIENQTQFLENIHTRLMDRLNELNEQENSSIRRSLRIQERPQSRQLLVAEVETQLHNNRKQPPKITVQCNTQKDKYIQENCPICLETKTFIRTQCKHLFCQCILQHICQKQQNNNVPSCPICREEFKKLTFTHRSHFNVIKSMSAKLNGIGFR
jgi:hypothetical protein